MPVRKRLIFPISASGSNFNPQNTQCIPVVEIIAFLELEKNYLIFGRALTNLNGKGNLQSSHYQKEERCLTAGEGIGTENTMKVTVRITNLTTGEAYTGRLPITGNQQIYLPVEIQKMLEDSDKIRIQILGG